MKQFYIMHKPNNMAPFIERADIEDILMEEEYENNQHIMEEAATKAGILFEEDHDPIEIAYELSESLQKWAIEKILKNKNYQTILFGGIYELYSYRAKNKLIREIIDDYTAHSVEHFEEYNPQYQTMTKRSINRYFELGEAQMNVDYPSEKHYTTQYKIDYHLKHEYLIAKTYALEIEKLLGKNIMKDEKGFFQFKTKWATPDEASLIEFNGLPILPEFIK